MWNNLAELCNSLGELGFGFHTEGSLCNELTDVTLIDDAGREIVLYTKMSEEYYEYLCSLPKDTEFVQDYEQYTVFGALFKCVISYPEGRSGGILIREDLDTLRYFWVALEAFLDPVQWVYKTMNSHIKNINYFTMYIKPILEKYDFFPSYDSFWDVEEKTFIGSTPTFIYTYKYYDEEVMFWTDLLTQKLMWGNGEVDKNTFEELFTNGLKNRIVFERFFTDDNTFTPTSYKGIYTLLQAIKDKRNYDIPVDFNNIPNTYKYLINEYNNLKRNNELC